ncbi:MAG: hypothetical protein LBU88_07715 [Treponema sp.]|jgi:hypothetical protein|nr:hypothetical protein [Treponema sp.]
MKKLLCIVLITFSMALILSCEPQSDYNYYFEIINDSLEDVSFDFNGEPETVPAESTKELGKAHYTALTNITVEGYGIKVKGTKGYTNNNTTITYTFYDIEPYLLNIINTLDIDVIIRAGNYVDYDEPAGDDPEGIKIEGKEEITDLLIYTNRPSFTVVLPKNPVIVDWVFNTSDETVYVTIR